MFSQFIERRRPMASSRGKRRRFAENDDGAATVLSLFLVISFLMLGGIAIDYANGERIRSQLQAAADAGATAALVRLFNHNAANNRAIEIAALTAPYAMHGNVLVPQDVVFGHWTSGVGTFWPGQTPINAVQVTTRRAEANGNALPTFILRLAGLSTMDVSAQAIALAPPNDCSGGGLLSRAAIKSSSNNTYLNGFCLYGRGGVEIGSDTVFESGTRIEMPRLSDFKEGGNNTGVAEALRETTHRVDLPNNVPSVISAMQTGDLARARLPSYIQSVVLVDSIDASMPLAEGSLYIVNGVADLGSERTVRNIAIVAEREIIVGSNVAMENVVFASRDKILFGSTNRFGNAGFCETGVYSVHAYSMANIEFGSQNSYRGLFLISRDMIKLGSDTLAAEGIYAEAINNIEYGSDETFIGCSDGLYSPFFEVTEVALVQ